MIRIHGFNHTVLDTDNLDAMLKFYCEVVDCVLKR